MAKITATPIQGISSMATRLLLVELCARRTALTGQRVEMQAIGGVDAAKRVSDGEAFDVVVLAADAIDTLIAAGHVVAGSRVDLVRSPVAVAVKADAARPDVSTPDALRRTLLAVRTIGYSTGPSGSHLVKLFERWGLASELGAKTVQAEPGVPVGELVARGEVEIGFQQLSEFVSLGGIEVLGLLPGDAAFVTTFSAGVPATATRRTDVAALLAFFNSNDAVAAKQRHGMEPC